MTVAQALQRQLIKKGLTQEQAAKELGVSRLTVNQLLNNRRTLTPEMALKMEDVFGIDAQHWLTLQTRELLDAARRDG